MTGRYAHYQAHVGLTGEADALRNWFPARDADGRRACVPNGYDGFALGGDCLESTVKDQLVSKEYLSSRIL